MSRENDEQRFVAVAASFSARVPAHISRLRRAQARSHESWPRLAPVARFRRNHDNADRCCRRVLSRASRLSARGRLRWTRPARRRRCTVARDERKKNENQFVLFAHSMMSFLAQFGFDVGRWSQQLETHSQTNGEKALKFIFEEKMNSFDARRGVAGRKTANNSTCSECGRTHKNPKKTSLKCLFFSLTSNFLIY